ncbi:MAG: PEP/pyruvate-binding domain-containing protein [Planctomycetota bacterium]|jgi:hypothetical protein
MRTTSDKAGFLILSFCLFVLFGAGLCDGGEIPVSPYWKEKIVFPDDEFRAPLKLQSDPRWVKFTILTEPYDANIVYFQDCREYAFHYHFAADLVTPFVGMTAQEFDDATLYEAGQQGILGAVIMPPDSGWPEPFAYPEYGIQFVRRDAYTKEEIAELFDIVKSSVQAEAGVEVFYFPSYEQVAVAEAEKEWFESQGIPISSASRWAPGNVIYSTGWALGELKYFQGTNIAHAYQTGQLEPNDILLTDGVPAEVPFVAGIISLSPSTPNSHVSILCRTYGVPFVHLALGEDVDHAWSLLGHRIVLRSFELWYDMDVRLIDVEGVLEDETIEEILRLKTPAELDISPVAYYSSYSASTDGLGPSDIQYFGGKASNFGMLRASIPENSPVAVAFSFDLWREFLGQTLFTGNTLREEIASRLAPQSYPPSDMGALSAELLFIRNLFTSAFLTQFSQGQIDAVVSVLQDPNYGFDANRKIRFRSSTNVEDSNQFTGAGLYDSYSGCLADDLDGDTIGPCLCDPNRPEERGVFRAIRKVFASFYNDNAYLERLRHGIDEADVGMALLVHHSFPDEIELANGVATVEKWYSDNWQLKLVTQLGAVSVANPEDGSIPEEVGVFYYPPNISPSLDRPSNLVPLGGTVLDWDEDYKDLAELLVTAAREFVTVTGISDPVLDFEYKKVAPEGKLVIKQIRQIPQPGDVRNVPTFLINEPVEYCTFQGEYGTVFANHRLKSRWLFETKNMWLSGKTLDESLYSRVRLEYLDRERIRTVSGWLEHWPFAWHDFEEGYTEYQIRTFDGWLMHHLPNRRDFCLQTDYIPIRALPAENPMFTLEDLPMPLLEVVYDYNVPTWSYRGPGDVNFESVFMCPCPKAQQGDLLEERNFKLGRGISVDISFYWPPPPIGPVAGYTAPLVRWVETVISGYTSEPIILRNWYSQTYRPEHHNFAENFIFEPRLDPNVPAELLEELRAKDIRMFYFYIEPVWDPGSGTYPYEATRSATYGFDESPYLAADLDGDKDVDGRDFALFGPHWRDSVCDDCSGADLTGDGCVSPPDLWELAAEWLSVME